jgi:hypothetical protein
MGIDSAEEIARLRENEAKKIKRSLKEGEKAKAETRAAPASFSEMYKK